MRELGVCQQYWYFYKPDSPDKDGICVRLALLTRSKPGIAVMPSTAQSPHRHWGFETSTARQQMRHRDLRLCGGGAGRLGYLLSLQTRRAGKRCPVPLAHLSGSAVVGCGGDPPVPTASRNGSPYRPQRSGSIDCQSARPHGRVLSGNPPIVMPTSGVSNSGEAW
jgi:hypothetical protein